MTDRDNTSYEKELEEQVESLKSALEKERDWNDFMSKRRDSQKYRRWCLTFILKSGTLPPKVVEKSKLVNSYREIVFETQNDMRNELRTVLEDLILDHYYDILAKYMKQMDNKFISFTIAIELFDQRKDKVVYSIRLDLKLEIHNKLARISILNNFHPHSIRDVDECILTHMYQNSKYVEKWKETFAWKNLNE